MTFARSLFSDSRRTVPAYSALDDVASQRYVSRGHTEGVEGVA